MFSGKKRWIVAFGSAATTVAAVAVVATMALGSGTVHASTPQDDGIGSPMFTTAPSNFSANATTIPYWQSSFTDPTNGVTYPYTMVGTSPFTTNTTTTIPTIIIPMSFTFARSASANNTLDGSTKVTLTEQSPMFQSADIGMAADATASAAPAGVAPSPRTESEPSDTTQVADAIYRSEFGKSRSNWHTLLGAPAVLPTVSFNVPRNQGFLEVGHRSGARIGLLDYTWFSDRLNETMRNNQIDPHALVIFLVYNTFLYEGDNPSNCCVLGYHGATTSLNGNGHQQVNTYMFASYSDPGIFAKNPGDTISYIQDIDGLSHEVQEWTNDPFVNNAINPWVTPTAPQYGCTGDLETGDPVVSYGFSVSMPNGVTYHPEDEVFYSWFARQSPSISSAGSSVYTYLNNFAGVAHGC